MNTTLSLLAASMVSVVAIVSIAGIVSGAAAGDPPASSTPGNPGNPAQPAQAEVRDPRMDPNIVPTGQKAAPEVKIQRAMFGAGCFWGVEARFRETEGVLGTAVGYAGGATKNPTYKQVCYEETGHAEVVLVEFDPTKISYEKLLEIFWTNHNPTTLNRQGPDIGTQYRSVVFFYGDEQKALAEKSKADVQASKKWGDKPIVTFIQPAPEFYKAEDYHQQYLEKRGLSTCHN